MLELCGHDHILGSSTTPTIPYTVNSLAEYPDMKAVVHRMHGFLDEDAVALQWRARAGTVAAETVLHDLGAIAMVSSDSQGMGRIGEVVHPHLADGPPHEGVSGPPDPQRQRAGPPLPRQDHDQPGHRPGHRPRRRLAGAGQAGGYRAVAPGVLRGQAADGGQGRVRGLGPVGSGNDSTRLGQPQIYRPMFGSYGAAPASLGVAFVSQASIDNGLAKRVQLRRKLSGVKNARPITKANFLHNQASPQVHVDPSSLNVEIDGKPVDLPPAETLPLTQRYFM